MEFAYHSEQEKKIILELREFKKDMPAFMEDFFVFLNNDVSAKTRLGYARDIKIFFNYLFRFKLRLFCAAPIFFSTSYIGGMTQLNRCYIYNEAHTNIIRFDFC